MRSGTRENKAAVLQHSSRQLESPLVPISSPRRAQISLVGKHPLSAVTLATSGSKSPPRLRSDAPQSCSSPVPDTLAIMESLTASPLGGNSRQGCRGMECQVS